MSLPQVSATISSVRAFVSVSIPLFTNMSKGRFASSRLGRNLVSSALGKVVHYAPGKLMQGKRVPESLRRYGE